MKQTENLQVGLCGIGLQAYWGQFENLKSRLEDHLREVATRLSYPGVNLVNLGLIDKPARGLKAGHQFRSENIDLLFIYVTTYAVSSIVLPLVQRAGVPVILLKLQPDAAMDYTALSKLQNRTAMTGRWLEYCSACPLPEIANVMKRAKIPLHQVTGTVKDDRVWVEIEEWVAAAKIKAGFRVSSYCKLLAPARHFEPTSSECRDRRAIKHPLHGSPP
ncbi:MAG TPA: hypothetical protein VND66_04955 [Acidobacteriaceae bacterium]|nr:hypothetical protein [Acidobacteriaceae bacterium]